MIKTMKMTLTMHGKVHSIEDETPFDHQDINEVAEAFKGLLVSAGFHPSNVDQVINVDAQWFPEDDVYAAEDPEGSTRDQMSYPRDFANKHDTIDVDQHHLQHEEEYID